MTTKQTSATAKGRMKTVCLKCNRPLEQHKQITAELVARVAGATYGNPIEGFRSPLSPKTIGQWVGHDPMMSTKEPTWPTPFGVTITADPGL